MEVPASQGGPSPSDTRGGRNRRRHRGGGNARGQRGGAQITTAQSSTRPSQASLALRPASVAPQSTATSVEPSSAEHSTTEQPPSGRGRSRRGGRGQNNTSQRGRGGLGGRGRGGQSQLSHGAHPQFGGQLTGNAASNLQADAPEFTPGKPVQTSNNHGHTHQNTRHPRRDSLLKSTAPDIATRTHEDIRNGFYECQICTDEVLPRSKVWSCKTCWTVFHLGCVRKWSQNEGSRMAQQQQNDSDAPPLRQWRCPGCNLPKDEMPSVYTCWCGKETDPRPMGGVPPHSCGQSCGKARIKPKDCPHACDQQCHAGPCSPCTYMGPEQSCFCGKNISRKRCIETKYGEGWTCGEVCGDIMPCGEHTCPRTCHEGLCGACEEVIDGQCYCGRESKPIACSDRQEEASSKLLTKEGVEQAWTGIFQCGHLCGRKFDCGEHECQQECHAQDLEAAHCPRSPDVITHCPCGKTPLVRLDCRRERCTDPIKSCQEICATTLSCGHACQRICHTGICPPCSMKVDIPCRCGRVTTRSICHQGNDEPPQCMRICKAVLNCGRHDCGEHCCPGERKASERLATKRKLRPLGGSGRIIDENFEAEHICTRLCGRQLKCGNHTCAELCHKGPCGSCREAIFEEVSCNCGKTVLQPPLPCGTKPPPCRFNCERAKSCGHPQIPHNCHGDEEGCPKCPFLVEKPCMCGKKSLKNQPCFLADVRCGEVCGKKLKCGSHVCRKPCHRPGECEDAKVHCQQLCGKEKKRCGHACEEICHAPSACKEERPCASKFLITCECQHLKTETKCLASRHSEGNTKKTLKCDDECAKIARNHQLAAALNIDPTTHTDDHIPYSTTTLKLYQEHLKWAQAQEQEMRIFAADDSTKRYRYKPMPSHYRAFIHSLGEDFGFDSESLDPEPHRHVVLFKTPRFVKAPMKTLAECMRIRARAVPVAPTVTAPDATVARLEAPNDPFNGFLLSSPRFALTIDELRGELATALRSSSTLAFDISFLPSEEIVLKAKPSSPTTTITPPSLEGAVKALKSTLAAAVSSKQLAASTTLCALDPSLNILRRESDKSAGQNGWSQVAAKAAGPRMAPRPMAFGSKSSFMVLGRKKKAEEQKKVEEEVVDDWEEEMNREEKEGGSVGEAGEDREGAEGSGSAAVGDAAAIDSASGSVGASADMSVD
jgi:transcriptional repressor NF-X1